MPATRQKPLKAKKPVKKQVKPKKPAPPKATPRSKLPTKRELEADKAKFAKKVIAKQKPPAVIDEIPGVVDFIPDLPAGYDRNKRVRATIEHMWDLEPEQVIECKPRSLGQAIVRSLYCTALRGDTRAFVEIRNTLGEMPTQKVDQRNTFVDANGNPITGVELTLVDSRPRLTRPFNIPQDTSGVNYGNDVESGEDGDAVAEPEA